MTVLLNALRQTHPIMRATGRVHKLIASQPVAGHRASRILPCNEDISPWRRAGGVECRYCCRLGSRPTSASVDGAESEPFD
jgi:hypothetical protein